MEKTRAPRNQTLTLLNDEEQQYLSRLIFLQNTKLRISDVLNKTICSDLFDILDYLPKEFVDLLIIDPPYNLDKNFNGFKFSQMNDNTYFEYLHSWFPKIMSVLKPNGSVYICGDWKNTFCLYQIMNENTIIRNRIIWQREKGRGTKSDEYYFDLDAVKQKRKVIAPYRENGQPKDWEETKDGKFRLTCPSNFWDDISIPYWSMPENTDHPTQKPEKLIAKIILASCPLNGVVLDPFLGSGTTSVVAKKLNRRYVGIEMNKEYCCWAEKRLELANSDKTIQGYSDGIFWERNTSSIQSKETQKKQERAPNIIIC